MDDLISRQAAIDAVTDELDMIDHVPQWVFDRLVKRLKQLPPAQPEVLAHGEGELSAQPERKKGKWIITKTERGWNCAEYPTEVTCSNCNYIEDYQKALDFCPNCGADMRGEQDE